VRISFAARVPLACGVECLQIDGSGSVWSLIPGSSSAQRCIKREFLCGCSRGSTSGAEAHQATAAYRRPEGRLRRPRLCCP
jgi:hypothetical protein